MHQTHLAAMTVCQQQGYHLFMEEVRVGARDWERKIRGVIKSTQLDGVLIVPPLSDELRLLKMLKAEKIAFVRLGPTKHLDITPYVHIDDRQAAYEQTKLLCELGHRDIAFIRGPSDHGSSDARFRGFEAAMGEVGARINPKWCTQVDYSNAKLGLGAGEALLSKQPRPTAVFAFNDELAIGVISAAQRLGLKVPEQVSVVGFDDSPLASMLWPGLTTVHQPIMEMALRAGEMLIDLIESRETTLIEKFDFDVVQRDSTAPLKSRRAMAGVRSDGIGRKR
jgi:LacI family transcriptional regulator